MAKLPAKLKEQIQSVISSFPEEEQPRVRLELMQILVHQPESAPKEQPGTPTPAGPKDGSKRAPGRRKPGFRVLPNPEFLQRNDKAKQSFAEFCDPIRPRTKQEKVAVSIAYLQTEQDLFPITLSHLLTCFASQKWLGEPENLLDCLWYMASERLNRLIETVDSGRNIRLSPEGIAYVDELRRQKRGGRRR